MFHVKHLRQTTTPPTGQDRDPSRAPSLALVLAWGMRSTPLPLSPLARYRRLLVAIRSERGERCEVCRAPTRAAHHINAVGIQGIASALTFEPGNLLLVCGHCHSLFHPGQRSYSWLSAQKRRGQGLIASGGRAA
jgi:hypothetical protein